MPVKAGKHLVSWVTTKTLLGINRNISFKGTVTLTEPPSWSIELSHASFHCPSVKFDSTWLMKRNAVKNTE